MGRLAGFSYRQVARRLRLLGFELDRQARKPRDLAEFLHALEQSRRRLPGTTCLVCERLLGRVSDEEGDSRTGRFGDTHTVSKLIFRTYQQHPDDEWTRPALDLIDLLCLEGVAEAGAELERFER